MRVIATTIILLNIHFGLMAQNKPTLDIIPNPFVDTTSFILTLPTSDTVSLVIYNLLGELIDSTIKEQLMPQGTQSLMFIGDTLPLGQYIVYLDVDTHLIFKKIIKVDQLPLGIENEKLKEPHLSFWPNPTTGLITLTHVPQEITRIAIYSVLGALIFDKELNGSDNLVIDLTEFPAGLYYLQTTSKTKGQISKIIRL